MACERKREICFSPPTSKGADGRGDFVEEGGDEDEEEVDEEEEVEDADGLALQSSSSGRIHNSDSDVVVSQGGVRFRQTLWCMLSMSAAWLGELGWWESQGCIALLLVISLSMSPSPSSSLGL